MLKGNFPLLTNAATPATHLLVTVLWLSGMVDGGEIGLPAKGVVECSLPYAPQSLLFDEELNLATPLQQSNSEVWRFIDRAHDSSCERLFGM